MQFVGAAAAAAPPSVAPPSPLFGALRHVPLVSGVILDSIAFFVVVLLFRGVGCRVLLSFLRSCWLLRFLAAAWFGPLLVCFISVNTTLLVPAGGLGFPVGLCLGSPCLTITSRNRRPWASSCCVRGYSFSTAVSLCNSVSF